MWEATNLALSSFTGRTKAKEPELVREELQRGVGVLTKTILAIGGLSCFSKNW